MKQEKTYRIVLGSAFILALGLPLLLFETSTISPTIFMIYFISRTTVGMITFSYLLRIFFLTMEHKQLRLFLIAGFTFFTAYLLETLAFLLLNNTLTYGYGTSQLIFMISQYLLTIAPLILMYFIVQYFTDHPNFFVFLPMFIDVLVETVLQPAGLVIGQLTFSIQHYRTMIWIYDPIEFWINVVYYLSILWFVIYVGYLVIKSKQLKSDAISTEQQNIFLGGIVLVFVISPLIFSSYIFLDSDILIFLWVSIVGRSATILGLMLFLVSYVRSSEKLDYFQPQPIMSLHLFDPSRVLIVHERQFKDNTNTVVIEFLVNNLDALEAMISEVTRDNTQIKSLDFGNSKIILRLMEETESIAILVVSYITDAIEQRFNLLIRELDDNSIINHDNSIDALVEKYFGV